MSKKHKITTAIRCLQLAAAFGGVALFAAGHDLFGAASFVTCGALMMVEAEVRNG